MKSILAIVTFLGLVVCSSALAQTNAAAGDQPASTQPAAGGAMSVHIEPTPLTTVIETLARQAGINYILDPKVMAQLGPVGPDGKVQEPSITLRWDNVTAAEALTALLNNYGLQIVEDPKTKIARITVKDPAALPVLVTKIVQLKFASPGMLVPAVQTVLKDARSKVVPDVRTSQLIVSATEPELEGVDVLVARLDTQTKQVLIEALLMETTRNPSTMKGVDWSGTLTAQNITFGNNALPGVAPTAASTIATAQGPVTTPGTPGTIGGILSDPKLLMSVSKGSFFSPSTAFLNADGVNAVLSFINKDADAQVLSTPRAVTLDNQEAMLSVSRALPIFASTAGTQGSPGGSQVTYTNVGTILHVTPRISANDFINLKVKPEVSSLAGTARKTVAGVVNEADIYDVRTISTEVMIPSGNTLVLGGLVSDDQTKGYTKVPILGDIPIVGLAFRSESKTQLKKNLLIFITPTIVKDTDFRPTQTEFLKSRPPEVLGGVDTSSRWEGAKPHDWSKPVVDESDKGQRDPAK